MNETKPGKTHIVFLLNLLQDVNIVRPLIFMASRDLGIHVDLLVTQKFLERDSVGNWRTELDEIAAQTGANIVTYENVGQALRVLTGWGAIVAGSESNLPAHVQVHEVFQAASESYRKITLQHGLECVGFLQNRDQVKAFGSAITFAADVVCGWMDGSKMTSMLPSERSKLLVTGPTNVLQMAAREPSGVLRKNGIVCENLHSVRLNVSGDFKSNFMDVFDAFCAAMARQGEGVTLRPHPGGQYMLKNRVKLQDNVRVNNNPMYKVDLRSYAYGISAPSSVLIDMVLAGIPTAAWRDNAGVMDVDNYEGITFISSLNEWVEFANRAQREPNYFIDKQEAYLDRLGLKRDQHDVGSQFLNLLHSAVGCSTEQITVSASSSSSIQKKERILFVSLSAIATLQISFIRPLQKLIDANEIEVFYLTETELHKRCKGKIESDQAKQIVAERFEEAKPTIVIFCRYSGPHAERMLELSQSYGAATMMHIDDDLLDVPETHGAHKFQFHNSPPRLQAVRTLLSNADFVYCSTPRLLQRMKEHGIHNEMKYGQIYCPGIVTRLPQNRMAEVIGYTGFREKMAELELVVPALENFLDGGEGRRLELVGDLPIPDLLKRFGERVLTVEPVREYEKFLEFISNRGWDIGICPLINSEFNVVKANTKWVEFTSMGIAVVASRGPVYEDCCADGCGILAEGVEEWTSAFELLATDPRLRVRQVQLAQDKLRNEFSMERLTGQVLDMLDETKRLAARA